MDPAVRPAPNPTDPFAAIKTGTQTPVQYQAQFRYAATVDPLDPFHNWGGNLWNQTWQGQWPAAHAKGQTFEQFWNAHASAEYKPRFVMSIQAEIEGRHWWPADSCLPNAYGGAGTFAFRYVDLNGPLVHFNNPNPLYEGRYAMVGRDFLPPDQSLPSYMGEAIAFWDGDELVVWTKNLHPNMRGHGEAEYSDQMEMIERYFKTGNSIVVDVTRYDPVAYAAPQHTLGVFTRANEYQVPIYNECVSTNNVYHDERGWISDVAPNQPGYNDIFDLTPWYTNWTRAEAAKKAGTAPPAPSIMDIAPRR